MRHIIIILIFLFLLTGTTVYAQKDTLLLKNTIYLSAGGPSALYSIDYDRILSGKKNFKLSTSIGIGIIPFSSYLSTPVRLKFFYHISKGMHIELIGGATYIKGLNSITDYKNPKKKYPSENIYFAPGLGMRYQKNEGGLFLMLGISPMFKVYAIKNEYLRLRPDDQPDKFTTMYLGLGLTF